MKLFQICSLFRTRRSADLRTVFAKCVSLFKDRKFLAGIVAAILLYTVGVMVFSRRGAMVLDTKTLQGIRGTSGSCFEGHVPGFPAVCGGWCLPKVSSWEENPKVAPINAKTQATIRKMPGWMEEVHYEVVRSLTLMQWSQKVYGSIGEFGAFYGKFFSVMALNSDKSREKLFVADVFDKTELLTEKIGEGEAAGNFERLIMNLKVVGINPERIDVWKDSTMFLDTKVFQEMGMQQFRLLSIDGGKQDYIVLNDLKLASCIIRDGGLVIINDVTHKNFPGVAGGLRMYFKMYGEKVLTPLVFVGNKLFLVAGQALREVYFQNIERTLAMNVKINLVKGGDLSKLIGFGSEIPYYVPT